MAEKSASTEKHPQPARTRLRSPGAGQNARGNATVNVLCATGIVTLVALGNHGRTYDVRQTTYASREDCLQDWGTEESCPASGQYQSGTYFGPRYYWDPGRNRPVVIGSDGAEHVANSARIEPSGSLTGRTAVVGSYARGGFGGIGRGLSSGRGG
jgi:hypothetical protein